MIITRPTGMQLQDWADQLVLDLDSYGSFEKLSTPDWQQWAVQFLNNTSLGNTLPNPYAHTEWTDWAERLCGVLT